MDFHVSRIDLKKTAESWPAGMPFKPALMMKQPTMHPDEWWVVDAPLEVGFPPSWSLAKQDQYVRIPLFQYDLPGESDLALARLLELGLSCAGYFPGSLKKVHVVTGNPVDLLYDDAINKSIGLRYWVGVAAVLDQK